MNNLIAWIENRIEEENSDEAIFVLQEVLQEAERQRDVEETDAIHSGLFSSVD